MSLWAFELGFQGGAITNQIVVAEGDDELAAADGVLAALKLSQGVTVLRPGTPMAAQEAERWRSLGDPAFFPLVVNAAGRFAAFAQGRLGKASPNP